MPEYQEGQSVTYKPIGGPNSNTAKSTGTIEQVVTEPTNVTGRNVNASEKAPRYAIKNDNTGKVSAVAESNVIDAQEK